MNTQNITITVSAPKPPKNGHSPAFPAISSLLSDDDDVVASLAMEQMLARRDDYPVECDDFLCQAQDSPDPAMRRHVQQLSAIISQRGRLEEFIHKFETNRYGFFEGALALDSLYSPKASPEFVTELARRLFADYRGPQPMTPESLVAFMTSHNFLCVRPPWINIGLFMIGDVLENGQGIPVLLCIIAHALAKSRGTECDICLCNGQFCLLFPDDTVINPLMEWSITAKMEKKQYSTCGVQQVLRYCLSMAMAFSAAAWEVYDVYFFQEIFRRLDGLKGDFLHYPYGDCHSPEK